MPRIDKRPLFIDEPQNVSHQCHIFSYKNLIN